MIWDVNCFSIDSISDLDMLLKIQTRLEVTYFQKLHLLSPPIYLALTAQHLNSQSLERQRCPEVLPTAMLPFIWKPPESHTTPAVPWSRDSKEFKHWPRSSLMSGKAKDVTRAAKLGVWSAVLTMIWGHTWLLGADCTGESQQTQKAPIISNRLINQKEVINQQGSTTEGGESNTLRPKARCRL